jgi:DNA primase
MNVKLLNFLEGILGKGDVLKKGEVAFYCPKCKHHKKKLQIHLEENNEFQHYHCWTCNFGGRSIISLLNHINKSYDKNKLKQIIGEVKIKSSNSEPKVSSTTYYLPTEFNSLTNCQPKNPHYNNAIQYLFNRGLTINDIIRYNIGYCETGLFKYMIIIPNYDCDNNLNFFSGRSFYEDEYKHKNCGWSKNIIGFENFINWDYPITLVEGAFDAIASRINTIPLYGKFISEKLFIALIEHNVKEIYIALDLDAIKNSIDIAEYLINNGILVHLIIVEDKDPSEMGYKNFIELKNNTSVFDPNNLFDIKLQLALA